MEVAVKEAKVEEAAALRRSPSPSHTTQLILDT
jgi:hypothetical protein